MPAISLKHFYMLRFGVQIKLDVIIVDTDHFCNCALCAQVAERALFLWNNDHIRNLIIENRKVILPVIFPSLEKNTRTHWNPAVQSLTLNVRKIFSDSDPELFEDCLIAFQENEAKEKELHEKRESIWKRLEDVAASRAISNEAVLVSQFSGLAVSTVIQRTVVGS